MGQTPSVQDDLLALKQLPAKSSKRRDAFRRVQGSMKVTTLPQQEMGSLGGLFGGLRATHPAPAPAVAQDLLKACAAVEALRFDVWPAPPEGASKLTQELAVHHRHLAWATGAACGPCARLLVRGRPG